MTKVKITKMQGCGNDFVILPQEELSKIDMPMNEIAKKLCDRHFGIGADGLIIPNNNILNTDIGYSTNLMKAFDEILSHAVNNHISNADLPKALIVISDMEIDPFFRPHMKWDFMQTVRLKFARAGYSVPKLILWNVEARQDTFLTKDEDVILVSGQSPSVFKQLCTNLNGKTAYDLMLETLNDKMYDCVTL